MSRFIAWLKLLIRSPWRRKPVEVTMPTDRKGIPLEVGNRRQRRDMLKRVYRYQRAATKRGL